MTAFQDYHRAVANLRPEQAARLPALEWLASAEEKDRGTGRTTLLALALIRASIANQTMGVRIFDHHGESGPGKFDKMRVAVMSLTNEAFLKDDGWLYCKEPAVPLHPSPPQATEILSRLMTDFLVVVQSCVRFGLDERWMKEQIDSATVRRVMTE